MGQIRHGCATTTWAVRVANARSGKASTNGVVERMNRVRKKATVTRYHDDSHDQLHGQLADFINTYINACNFARRLKV